MFWGVVATVLSALEQLAFGFFLPHVSPLLSIPIFYFAASVFTLAGRRLLGKRETFQPVRDRSRKLIAGYLGGAIVGNGLWFASILLLGLGETAVLLILVRVFAVLYGVLVLKERMSAIQTVSALVILCALSVFAGVSPPEDHLALTLCLISTLALTLELICFKQIVGSIAVTDLVALRQCTQFLAFSGIALLAYPHVQPEFKFSLGILSVILATAFVGGLLVNVARYLAIDKMKLSTYSLLTGLKPVLVLALSVMILDERFTETQLAAASCMLAASFFLFRPIRSQPST